MQETLLQFSHLAGLTAFFKSLDDRPYRINITELTLSARFSEPELDLARQCDPSARVLRPDSGERP